VLRAGSRVAVASDGHGPAERIREMRRRQNRVGVGAEGWTMPHAAFLVKRVSLVKEIGTTAHLSTHPADQAFHGTRAG